MNDDEIAVTVIAADTLTVSTLERCIRSTPGMFVARTGHTTPGSTADPLQGPEAGGSRRRRSAVVIDLDHWEAVAVDEARRSVDSGETVIVLAHKLPPALVRRCVRAGVHAVLTKSLSTRQLLALVVRVVDGEKYVDPGAAAEALAHAECPLTPRERDVMRLVAHASGSADVAAQLHLAVGTVRNLVASACRKIGEPDRTRAAAEALDRGWL